MNIIRNQIGAGEARTPMSNSTTSGECRKALRVHARRGMALLLVMVAVSASLVITLAFVRTQTSCIRIRQNSTRRDVALQAAHTGAAVALETMHSTTWAGVDVSLSRTILSDAEGTSSYEVEYQTIEETNPDVVPGDAPLYVVVVSTGRWVSAADPSEVVSRQVQVITKLLPRVPGRTINAGDSANASDVTPNPGGYDTIQTFTGYQRTAASKAMMIEPCGRVEGNISANSQVSIYVDALWNSTVRGAVLDNLGSQYGTTTGGTSIAHPHPLNGSITFRVTPNASVQSDLAKLGIPWSYNASVPTWPSIDYAGRVSYKLFQGGFTYTAETIGSSLISNVTLKPTATNPLGIFYRNGSLNVHDGTNIRGTLVCTGLVVVGGRWVHLASPNWRDDTGAATTWNGDNWPRLPAIVAANVTLARDATATITGAIVCDSVVSVLSNHHEMVNTTDIDISGTATSWPVAQPKSIVQLTGSPDLSSVNTTGNYSIWLENGSSGSWHEILGVDNALKQLTVIGEVTRSSPVNCRIRRTRKAFADVQGPISSGQLQINLPLSWRNFTATNWTDFHAAWTAVNVDLAAQGLPAITFIDYLADPARWVGWASPMNTYGLKLEPAFHLRNTSGIKYLWNGPLFTPYNGTGGNAPYAGFRWKVLSWRELS